MGALMKKLKDQSPKTDNGKISSVRFSSESEGEEKVPAGSEILSRSTSVDIEEIENGFIINKRTEVKYMAPKKEYSDYCSYTKKWYSKTNPLTINSDDKELADLFD